jgi:hypothetical protein
MTRDWLLTLLAMLPYFLAATIVVLAITRKPMQIDRVPRAAEASAPRVGVDYLEEAIE